MSDCGIGGRERARCASTAVQASRSVYVDDHSGIDSESFPYAEETCLRGSCGMIYAIAGLMHHTNCLSHCLMMQGSGKPKESVRADRRRLSHHRHRSPSFAAHRAALFAYRGSDYGTDDIDASTFGLSRTTLPQIYLSSCLSSRAHRPSAALPSLDLIVKASRSTRRVSERLSAQIVTFRATMMPLPGVVVTPGACRVPPPCEQRSRPPHLRRRSRS